MYNKQYNFDNRLSTVIYQGSTMLRVASVPYANHVPCLQPALGEQEP